MQKFFHLIALGVCVVVSISGCSTKTPYYAMGGSRADGTVDMAYDFKPFETAVVDRHQAQSVAKSKCQVWGYADAEIFGGMTQNCYARNGFGTCTQGQVIEKYQCLGDLGATRQSAPSQPQALQRAQPAQSGTGSSALDKKTWQDQQIQKLQDSDISYEEYQARYRKIMGE